MKNVITFLKWLFMPFKVFQLVWYFFFKSYWKELSYNQYLSAEELKKDERPLLTEFTVAGRVYELHRHPHNKNYAMLKDQKTGRIVIQGTLGVVYDEKKDILYIRKWNWGVKIYRLARPSHLSLIDRYWLLFPEKELVASYGFLVFEDMFEMDGRWLVSSSAYVEATDTVPKGRLCVLEDIETKEVLVSIWRESAYTFRPFKNPLGWSIIELSNGNSGSYEHFSERQLLYSLTHRRIILDMQGPYIQLKEISFWYTENNQLYLLGQQPYKNGKCPAKTMIFVIAQDHVVHPILETLRAFEVLHEYPDVSPLMRIFLIRYIQYGQFSLKGANSKTLLNVPRQDLSQGASPIAALIEHKTAHRIKHIAATEFFFESKKISKTTARVRVL